MTESQAMVGSLDMTDERDRGLLRRKVGDELSKHRRWEGITDEFKAQAVQALRAALYMATNAKDHRGINGCVKTLALLEGQNQKDEHVAAGVGAGATVNIQQNAPAVYRLEVDRGG